MKPTAKATGGPDFGWTRVSSLKPYVIGLLLIGIAAACLIRLLPEHDAVIPLVTAGISIAAGLMALNWKVVHQRGNDYRITTLYYSEVVTVDDVCMTVKNPGPFWTRLRVHLRRPARFGWMISFVPAHKSSTTTLGQVTLRTGADRLAD
jgi:hypothetical protein